MTYKRAQLIRSLIDDITSKWDTNDLVAAIQEEPYVKDSWEVCLYSRGGYPHHLIQLAGFACSLDAIACDIHYTMSEYNKATYGEEIVQAVKIW